MQKKPIGAYATESRTGWAAYDKEGHTWPVDDEEAVTLEKDRKARISNAAKLT